MRDLLVPLRRLSADLKIKGGATRNSAAMIAEYLDQSIAEIKHLRARLDRALTVCRSAGRVIASSAYQGVSDEDCDLESAVKNWQLMAADPAELGGGEHAPRPSR